MKYIITESKLEKVIMRYLDSLDLRILDKINHIYFIRGDEKHAFIVYDKDNADSIINYELIDDITNIFSLDGNYSEELIGKWVGNTLNKEVKGTKWMF